MEAVYFIGGPWDLHKVAFEREPRDCRITMRAVEPIGVSFARNEAEAKIVEHIYIVEKLAPHLFAAIHEPTHFPEWGIRPR